MKNDSTTKTRPQPTGLSPIVKLAGIYSGEVGALQNTGAIMDKYPELTRLDAMQVAQALRELATCETCAGYPCKMDGIQPMIMTDETGTYVSRRRCRLFANYAKAEAMKKQIKNAKIPPRYKGKTFADYRVDDLNRSAVDFAKGILTEGYSGGYFYGGVGTGKTFLAAIIAQEFVRAGKTVLFEKVADLLTEFYAVYRGEGTSEDSLLRTLYDVDLLILDDFGIEKATQFVGTTLCKILDARYDKTDAVTIITSNYSLKQLEERLNNPTDMPKDGWCLNGSRIRDRCLEICKPILFKGDSRRR